MSDDNSSFDELEPVVEERRRKLVTAVASGVSLYRAATELGIDPDVAHAELQAGLAKLGNERTLTEVRQTELVALAHLQQAVMRKAMTGDTDAAKIVMAIMDRRARYLGLDD